MGYAVDEQRVPTPPVDVAAQEFIMHQLIEDMVEQ
jgi:hypothetical protein